MMGFIVGLFIGVLFLGFAIAAIIVVCHDADERKKRTHEGEGYMKGDEMR